jgi:Uma2 family endonuclease
MITRSTRGARHCGHTRLQVQRRAEHHMAMPATHENWTVDMLDALPDDGQRYEIIDGVVCVTPAPSDVHQLVLGAFYLRIAPYLLAANAARALFSPADVRKDDRKRNRVQPDLFAVRLIDGKRPVYPYSQDDLLLVLEVLSPGNPLYDHHVKRELYLTNGVREYWIVDAEARTVTRWRSLDDPGEVFTKRIEWHPQGMERPLAIELPSLFAEALA